MAVNPYFPATYQAPVNPYQIQMMQNQLAQMQQQMQPMQAAPQSGGGLVWVQGIEGAKSHQIGAGQSVLLMDSESNCFFIKAADASGMPLPLRIFDYKERAAQSAQNAPTAAANDMAGFITRDEFEARIAQICAEYAPKKRQTRKESVEDGE